MTGAYYKLEDDVYLEGRWFLNGLRDDSGTELDSRDFTHGRFMKVSPSPSISLWNEEKIIDVNPPLRVSWSREGKPLDFTYAAHDMPVVTARVADLIAATAASDIQRVPVRVDKLDETFEIINVISLVDCIDTERSEIQWFEEGNKVRPDLAGTPEMITKLVIDSSRTDGHNVLRPKGWDMVIIVSGFVKDALEAAQVTGVKFRQVCP